MVYVLIVRNGMKNINILHVITVTEYNIGVWQNFFLVDFGKKSVDMSYF